jgi:hypothetical protein
MIIITIIIIIIIIKLYRRSTRWTNHRSHGWLWSTLGHQLQLAFSRALRYLHPHPCMYVYIRMCVYVFMYVKDMYICKPTLYPITTFKRQMYIISSLANTIAKLHTCCNYRDWAATYESTLWSLLMHSDVSWPCMYVCMYVCMCTYIHMSGTKWNCMYVCRDI